MSMENIIIVPTYNEVGNVEAITKAVFKILPETHILFVDDNSPDGTGKIIDKLVAKDKRIKVLHRSGKLGFASAYIDGFRKCIAEGYKYICEMDCDFSHDPQYLPEMFKQIKKYDYVIGSRYVPGGGTKNWGLGRRIMSRFGNYYARGVLLSPITDLTGGYACWRKEVLEGIGLDNIKSKGFSFQIELKTKAYRKGFKFGEIPIIFEDRKVGTSKMSKKIFIEGFTKVWMIKFDA